jgi:hypothetical protein
VARIRVQQLAGCTLCQPDAEMLIKSKEEKRVRAAKSLTVFAGLACRATSKNRDKPIKHTVRVRCWRYFNLLVFRH